MSHLGVHQWRRSRVLDVISKRVSLTTILYSIRRFVGSGPGVCGVEGVAQVWRTRARIMLPTIPEHLSTRTGLLIP